MWITPLSVFTTDLKYNLSTCFVVLILIYKIESNIKAVGCKQSSKDTYIFMFERLTEQKH